MKNINLKMIETEHGKFTDIEELGISAEECYKQYLVDKDKPLTIDPTVEERIKSTEDTLLMLLDMQMGGI